MSKIVEKWVAGFWSGRVIVVKWKFRETQKTFVMVEEPDNPVYDDAKTAVGWGNRFLKGDPDQRLFDTWEEALDRLHRMESKLTQGYRDKIGKCQDRMSLLGRISDQMKKLA